MNLTTLSANLVCVETSKGRTYFSYDVPIAHYVFESETLYTSTAYYSKTTSKHVNKVEQIYLDKGIKGFQDVAQSFLNEMK